MNPYPFPKTIDWFVTSKCNLKCGFCYGPTPELKEDPRKAILIAEKIISSKSSSVTLCGGEPFFHPKILDIIQKLKDGGKKVYISTNGHYLDQYEKAISNVEMISFGLDGHNDKIYQSMRGVDADLDLLLRSILSIKKINPDKLKIATVISKKNINNIIELGDLISEIGPKIWRIFKFIPRERGFSNDNSYQISDKDFDKAVTILKSRFSWLSIHSSNEQENSSCFILDHNGHVSSPIGNKYHILGNCFEEDIDSCWAYKWDRKELHFNNKEWMEL